MPKRTDDSAETRRGRAGRQEADTPEPETGQDVLVLRAAAPPRPRATRRPAARVGQPARALPAGSGPGARVRPAALAPGARRRPPVLPRRRPRKRFVLLGLLVIVLTAGLGSYGVVTAGFFRVQQVDVAGASYVDAEEIARATGARGMDLFRIDVEAVRQRVERVSGVRSAVVERIWPRRLVVTVEERAPVALWQVGGVGYVVDGDGMVLDYAPDPAMLTIIQTDGARSLVPGDRVDGDAVLLAARLRDLTPSAVGQRAVRFEWTQRDGLEVTTDRGLKVRLGDGTDLDYKLAVWRGILDQARKDRSLVQEIDLRFGDRVYYR